MKAPGSPSSALQMMYLTSPGAPAAKLHFMPVEKPAPPRPRRPQFFTSSITCCRRHLGERLAQGGIAATLKVVVDVLGVDDARVAQHYPPLLVEEGVLGAGQALAAAGPLLDHATTGHRLIQQARHPVGGHVDINDRWLAGLAHLDERLAEAHAHAARDVQVDV